MRKYMKLAILTFAISQPAFADVFVEDWPSTDIGIIYPSSASAKCQIVDAVTPGLNCPGTNIGKYAFWTWTNDPNSNPVGPYCANPGPNTCYAVDTTTSPHKLRYHGEIRTTNGIPSSDFQIISTKTFPKNHYISIEAEMSAACTRPDGICFAGLALYNAEANYREIAYRLIEKNGVRKFVVERVGGCKEEALINPATQQDLEVVPGSTHKLRLDYYGHVPGGKWIYFVDDIVQWTAQDGKSIELPNHPDPSFNVRCDEIVNGENIEKSDIYQFQADPHYALWFEGRINDTTQASTAVEGAVGKVSVYTGEYQDQSQPTTMTWSWLSDQYWAAQHIQMGSGATNNTMVQLHLRQGYKYLIEAHKEMGSGLGALINSTVYEANVEGLQYVPLWVPDNYWRIWLVVKGFTSGAAVGVTSVGTKPYPYTFMSTTDGGATWAASQQNMTFTTFERK